jgi:hypothetical protein
VRVREPAPPPRPEPRPCGHPEILQDGKIVPACLAIIDLDDYEAPGAELVWRAHDDHFEWALDGPLPGYRVREELLDPSGRPYRA